MRATLVHVSNPLMPRASREVIEIRRRRRLSKLAPKTDRPLICIVNGQAVLRRDWNRCIEDGDAVAFVTLPQGGGGGSNPIATVAMLALMVYGGPIAGALNSALGLNLAADGIGMMALKIGVELVGSALVNALMGPPIRPKHSLMPNPSPTYSLSARGNTNQLQQPIPVQYGRMMTYPSYAAEPYTEYAGNEQYLYQLLCLGQGSFSIEAIRLLTTDIGSFPGVTYEVVQPGASVTLFPANVVTSGLVTGQELMATNEPGAPPSVTIGPFAANAPATQTNAIAIDIVLPRGLFYANDSGGLDQRTVTWLVEYQLIDDNGNALGNWTTLGNETLTLATNTPQRLSYRYAVALGRYQVRATRTNAKDLSSRAANDLIWGAMRAYLPGSQQYGDITLIAVRMLATNVLSSATSNKINVIATRLLPTWNPTTGWSAPVATRSIAWALADCCRASYSAGLPDSHIDLNALYTLETVWASRGDYFDAVFDSGSTFWQALTQIARAGRAKPYWQTGIVHFVRDQPQSLPVAMFTPQNIVRSSFKINYLMPTEQTPDSVIVQYVDSTTWLPATVQCTLPGSTATKPAQLQLFGVTDRNHAWREGMYEAACNRYRRKLPQWKTELEGLIPSFGDMVAVSHDMPQWGQTGEVVDVQGLSLVGGMVMATGTILMTLSEPLTYTAGQQHYIAFRNANGSMSGPWQCSEGTDPHIVVLSQTPDMIPYTGSSKEATHFAFGPASSYATNVLIRSARPRNDYIVELSAVNDDPNVHTADQTGTVPAAPGAWALPAQTDQQPVDVTTLEVVQSGTPESPTLSPSWAAAAGADHYLVQISYDAGQSWTNAAEPSTPGCSFSVMPGAVMIRVAAVGLTVSTWVTWNGTAGSGIAPPSNVLNLALLEPFTGPVAKFGFSFPARASSITIQIWAGNPLALVRTRTITVDHFEYSAADATADGGPWRNFTIMAQANGSGGSVSAWSSLAVTNPQVGILGNISVTGLLASFDIDYGIPTDSDFSGIMVFASTTTGFTPGPSNLLYSGNSSPIVINGNPNETLYFRFAAYDAWGKDSLNYTGEYSATTQLIVTTQITDGSISTPKLAANSVDATKMNVAQLSAITATIGTLRTATTGARTEISDNVIKVYDSTNAKRVQIGDLML